MKPKWRVGLILSCFFVFVISNVIAGYPTFAQTDEVKTINIDTDSTWKSLDTEVKGWTSAAFDDSWWLDSWEESTPIPGLSQAKAIWYPQEPKPQTTYFRKTFQIDGTEIISTRITIHVKQGIYDGDTIEIYVNEEFVGKETSYWLDRESRWDFDISPFLTTGKNVIAVKVFLKPAFSKPEDEVINRTYWGLSGEIRYRAAPLAISSPTPSPSLAPEEPSSQSGVELGQPYVDLYGQVTDVAVGGEIIASLSTVNPITSSGTLVVQLTLRVPSGWSITSSGFGNVVGGMSTNSYEIEQGPNTKSIEVHILANEAYEGHITGYMDYYFKGEESKYHAEVSLPVKATLVEPTSEVPIPLLTSPEDSSEDKGSGTTLAVIIVICIAAAGLVLARVIYRRRAPVPVKRDNSDTLPLPRKSEGPKPYKEARKDDPLAPNRVPREMVLDIKEGQKGISYERLFSPYVRGATIIKIYDPYIKMAHQAYNLLNFCEILDTHGERVKVELVTARDSTLESQQEKKLDEIKKGLLNDNIELEYEFNDKQHDRWIETDTGWRIMLGRGLDIFQPREDYYGRGFSDQTKRKCRATTITYTRL